MNLFPPRPHEDPDHWIGSRVPQQPHVPAPSACWGADLPPQEGSMAVVLPEPPSPRGRAAPPVLHVPNQPVVLLSPEEPGGTTARTSDLCSTTFLTRRARRRRCSSTARSLCWTPSPLAATAPVILAHTSDPCRRSCPIRSQAGWAQQSPEFSLEALTYLWEWGDTTATPNHTA